MWLRLLTAFLCLIALSAEITLDSSTSFVRVQPKVKVGKLVVEKDQASKVPANPTSPSPSPDFDLFSGPVHVGNLVLPILAIDAQVQVSRLEPLADLSPLSIRLNLLDRPPSV